MADTQAHASVDADGTVGTVTAHSRKDPPVVCEGGCLNPADPQSKRVYSPFGVAPTLNSGTGEGMNIQPSVLVS